MDWLFLVLAAVFEMGWPLGFKLSRQTKHSFLFLAGAVLCMALSGFFLWLAQKSIPMGTAYAVWTGIGAAGTLILGIVFFQDSVSFARLFSAFLILAGVVGLKLFP